jgi:Flp pilus assembly secretin CpaC
MKIRAMMAMAAGAAACLAPAALKADTSTGNTATPAPLQSQVQTHLRLELKDDVKEVHFVNTNNDPYVYTKVYFLKNADPYELRPYVIGAVGGYWSNSNTYSSSGQGRRIDDNPTRVECIKYMDGVGAIVVSAEDYRFTKNGNENGMSIDDIINILDQPKIESSSAQVYSLYFPKFQTAAELSTAIKRVGLNGNMATPTTATDGNQWELQQGKDRVRTDTYLNALLFYTPAYSIKSYQEMLAQYDKPNPEVLINYTVYEYSNEIDSQVGDDFQAWKNGPGQDLFSVAGRYTNGWDISNMNVARSNGVSSNSAKYMNFNPKWNTKYIDLLASKSLAKVVTSGSLSLFNNKVGSVASTIGYPTIKDGSTTAVDGITEVAVTNTVTVTSASTLTGLLSRNNVAINGFVGTGSGKLTLYRYKYQYTSGSSSTLLTDYYYEANITNMTGDLGVKDANGKNLGSNVILLSTVQGGTGTVTSVPATTFTVSSNVEPTALAIQHAPTQVSSVAYLGTKASTSDYGFNLTIGAAASGSAPVLTVCETTTTVPVSMTNTNLIGFTSNGMPRTSKSQLSTVVVANNKGEKFVIGGLEKETVIRSANKVPYLGDIPGIGWILGNERETHKKTQLVAVIDVIPVLPDTAVASNVMGEIAKDKTFIGNYGVKAGPIDENDYGFDQFLLDSEKKSFDPLP